MANAEKTQREYFVEAIEVVEGIGRDDLADFFRGRIAALDRKSEKAKETKEEDVKLMDTIKEILQDAEGGMTVTEIKETGNLAESAPKITAMLKKLVTAGEVINTKDKKKSYYEIAEADEVETE